MIVVMKAQDDNQRCVLSTSLWKQPRFSICFPRELLGSRALWPVLLAFSGAAALVPLLTLPFFPESPPHLLLHKGDEEGCVKGNR